LRELRETLIWLKIIERKPLLCEPATMTGITKECGELIASIVTSVETAEASQ
jgi:hypothetical protein